MTNPYLQAMGIEQWVLRTENTDTLIDLPSCYVYVLTRQQKKIGFLLAEASSDDKAIESMLMKIITALKCEGQGQWYAAQPRLDITQDIKFVIELGNGFECDMSVAIIKSYSPQQLIDQPALKSETWKTLQRAFDL